MSYYNLAMVICVFLLAIITIVMTYLKRDFTKKIVKRTDVLLGSILLLALWYTDILVLGMSEWGFKTIGGIIPIANSQTYAILLFLIAVVGMITITAWWWFENERIIKNRSLKKWNRLLLFFLGLGTIFFIIAALSLAFKGSQTLIWNMFTPFSMYHLSLPFIILPTIAMMLEEKL